MVLACASQLALAVARTVVCSWIWDAVVQLDGTIPTAALSCGCVVAWVVGHDGRAPLQTTRAAAVGFYVAALHAAGCLWSPGAEATAVACSFVVGFLDVPAK